MIKEAVGVAATLDEAIENAKMQLNAPLDTDVKFDVLQQPQKKVLGLFGGKEAKVRVYYEIPEKAKTESVKASEKKAPAKPPVGEPKKEEKKEEKKESAGKLSAEDDEAIKKYLTTILKGMGVEDITVLSHDDEDETVYELNTAESHGSIIGRHGETLDAVQYLVRLFANKNTDGSRKVSINIGDYREKRAESLKEFAARSAKQVLKYGRNVKLDPMNPYERRIVHTAIQEIEGVTSHSVGYDTERRVIITLEEGVQPTHADRRRPQNRGGYNKGGRGGYNKGGYNKGGRRDGYKPNVPSDRTPKSDVAGSRYGKIEVKKNSGEQ